jgi:hypothetical protein
VAICALLIRSHEVPIRWVARPSTWCTSGLRGHRISNSRTPQCVLVSTQTISGGSVTS